MAHDAKRSRWRVTAAIGLGLAASGLVLFPFDWLESVWPAYGELFDRIFVGPREHAIGHAALFAIAGALVLVALPAVRRNPALYLAILAAGALAEEAVQDHFKRQMPTPGDARDLLFDALGLTVAYAVALIGHWLIGQRAPRIQGSGPQ